jgi:hypothetical protein
LGPPKKEESTLRTYYRAGRILAGRARSTNDERVTAYEAAVLPAQLRAGREPLCTHDWTLDAVRRDPTLDNAARAAVQAAGQAACRAAQKLADLAAKAK